MSSKKKLIARLKSKPKNLTWKEVTTLCKGLGFKEIQGNGSRVKFFHEGLGLVICVHKPHPSNVLKEYVIKRLLNELEIRGLI